MELLARLAGSGRKNVFVYRAMVTYGTRLIDHGRKDEGVKVLRKIPKESGGYHEVAKFYLEEIYKLDKKTENPVQGG